MKKILLAALSLVFVLTGCSSDSDVKEIDTLNVSFVPSAPADEILKATEPLEGMLKEEMSKQGFTVNNVNITVGTSYEAVGEALTAGTTDIALIPGGTYVLYEDDGAVLALTATRDALSVNTDVPADWNAAPTEYTEDQATFYRSLIVAGPSKKGQELQDKVDAGTELTFEDLSDATWCVQSPSSSAGYLYPTLWLSKNYDGKTINDLPNKTEIKGYGEAASRLSTEQCDIAPMYADARMDNGASWSSDKDIFEATGVIGVTDGIMNDTISVSSNSDVYSEDFLKAVQESFLAIAATEEGLKTVEPYSHKGYEIGDPKNYDDERKVQEEVIANL
ncbi:PhnD/SsuA/transferrin family substrate-binding protein [Mollicutes bacterium LVI A0039]|nr:PhnD/SsuA/transferrin family substrate-binding protein [Mollicutes bacterium LVI A0039]